MNKSYCVATFHSTYQALNFEKVMKTYGIAVRLMPVPRQVSTSCGTAAEIPCNLKKKILEICKEVDVEMDEVHLIQPPEKSGWFLKFMNKTS